MPQANTENRYLAGEVPNQFNADACVLRRARTGRDYDALRSQGFNLSNRNLIVASHLNLRAEFSKILNEVVGKGIVIVEYEDHGNRPAFSLQQLLPAPNRTGNLHEIFEQVYFNLVPSYSNVLLASPTVVLTELILNGILLTIS
jgi:hypothetical protein